jgi:hypothetical protein
VIVFVVLGTLFVVAVLLASWQDHRNSGLTDGTYGHRDYSTDKNMSSHLSGYL